MMMDENDRQSLTDHAVLINKDLVVDEEFLAYFEKDRILSPGMIEEIEVKKTRAGRAREFLRIIPKRGQRGYERFFEALMETGQEHIANQLSPSRAAQWQSGRSNSGSSNISIFHPMTRRTIPDTGESLITIDVLDVERRLAQHIIGSGEAFPFKSKPRGRAVILNNEYFVNKSEREGSTFDAVNLDQLFVRLGFEVETWKDLPAADIMKQANKERSLEIHKNSDAFIFTILSHGNRGNIFGHDGKPLALDSLFAMFDGNACPHLINKPKIFIIQACQGDLTTLGTIRSDGDGDADADTEKDSRVVPEVPVPMPEMENLTRRDTSETVPMVHEKADFVLAYSTVPGYKSWRNTQQGTWFIRDLIYTFMERCHQDDLIDMLREVNRKQRSRIADRGQKQISETRDSTDKKIYFLPGFYE